MYRQHIVSVPKVVVTYKFHCSIKARLTLSVASIYIYSFCHILLPMLTIATSSKEYAPVDNVFDFVKKTQQHTYIVFCAALVKCFCYSCPLLTVVTLYSGLPPFNTCAVTPVLLYHCRYTPCQLLLKWPICHSRIFRRGLLWLLYQVFGLTRSPQSVGASSIKPKYMYMYSDPPLLRTPLPKDTSLIRSDCSKNYVCLKSSH